MKNMTIIFVFLFIMSFLFISEITYASPPSINPPTAPKTKIQIATEAYAIEASVKANAGRKTNINDDGQGTPAITGNPPVVGNWGNIYVNSSWTNSNLTLCFPQVFHLATNDTIINLNLSNVYVDGCGLTGVWRVNDSTTSEIYLWDNITAVNIRIHDSTIFNATSFFHHDNFGGNYRVGSMNIYLDNVTFRDYGTLITRNASTERENIFIPVDNDFINWNRADNAACALIQDPQDYPYFEKMSMYRNKFIANQALTTGCATGSDIVNATDNYFEGGFLQLAFGADFEHGVSGEFASPYEYLNWSHNYANNSMHTVFGFYGTATGSFANHFSVNAYATIYNNYINNSRYIPIQSAGNQTNLRIINNYLRGPSPWPGGIPTFEFAISVYGEVHNYIIANNSLWDMDSTNIVGIDVGFAAYDISVNNNVIYDVGGNHIRIEGMDLKYRLASDNSEASDYSWRDMNVTISNNYLSGGTNSRAIMVDSGYIKFINNSIVNGPPSGNLDIVDGWGCHPNCSYVWIDWIDGFPDELSIRWPIGVTNINETYFWVRTMRTSSVKIDSVNSFIANIITSNSTYFGSLLPRCVVNFAGTGGHTTTDAEILTWTNKTCPVIADISSFNMNGPINKTMIIPEKWFNKTLTISFNPNCQLTGIPVTLTVVGKILSLDQNQNFALINNSWAFSPAGHSYQLTILSSVVTLGQVYNWFILIIFLVIIITAMYVSWRFKKWRGKK